MNSFFAPMRRVTVGGLLHKNVMATFCFAVLRGENDFFPRRRGWDSIDLFCLLALTFFNVDLAE